MQQIKAMVLKIGIACSNGKTLMTDSSLRHWGKNLSFSTITSTVLCVCKSSSLLHCPINIYLSFSLLLQYRDT